MEPPSEFLVISRGQWDPDISKERIQTAIDQFYVWLEECVAAGKMRKGQRLGTQGKTIYKNNTVTDGPYGESKEVIGGYWFILARTLEEAAEIGSGNPCLNCGLFFELRPIELDTASAYVTTNENLGR